MSRQSFLWGNGKQDPATQHKKGEARPPPIPTVDEMRTKLNERQFSEMANSLQTRMWCVAQAVHASTHSPLSADDLIKLTGFFHSFVSAKVTLNVDGHAKA